MPTQAAAADECALAGRTFYETLTLARLTRSTCLSMVALEDPGADSELQRIFLWYTRAKGRTSIGPNDKVGGTLVGQA